MQATARATPQNRKLSGEAHLDIRVKEGQFGEQRAQRQGIVMVSVSHARVHELWNLQQLHEQSLAICTATAAVKTSHDKCLDLRAYTDLIQVDDLLLPLALVRPAFECLPKLSELLSASQSNIEKHQAQPQGIGEGHATLQQSHI